MENSLILNHEFHTRISAEIQRAEKEILVGVYQAKLYPENPRALTQKILIELLKAQNAGVSVKIITDFPDSAEKLRAMGFAVVSTVGDVRFHSKFYIFDESSAIVGSHNLTESALKTNREVSYYFTEPENVDRLRAEFLEIWGRNGGAEF